MFGGLSINEHGVFSTVIVSTGMKYMTLPE